MIFSPYGNASCGDESIGFLALAISLFPIILPSATIQPFNVGYNSNELRSGSSGLVSQFVSTSGGAIDLQDIKCNDAASDSVSFMILDNIGLGGDSYYWVNWYEGEDGAESCWVDSEYAKVEGMTIQPGQGLWVAGDSSEQIFQSAGQVGTADVAVQLRSGSTMTGNSSPVEIDLQDIVCTDNCSDSVSFMILDNIGLGGDSYYWVNWYEGEDGAESCWVNSDFEKVSGMTIQPGQGLWVAGDSEEQYITFPGVEL